MARYAKPLALSKTNLIGEVKGTGRKPNDNLQVYWDTEKEEYRCFKKCNLIKIA